MWYEKFIFNGWNCAVYLHGRVWKNFCYMCVCIYITSIVYFLKKKERKNSHQLNKYNIFEQLNFIFSSLELQTCSEQVLFMSTGQGSAIILLWDFEHIKNNTKLVETNSNNRKLDNYHSVIKVTDQTACS